MNKHIFLFRLATFFALVITVGCGPNPTGPGNTIVVTKNDDSGSGTLRQALSEAVSGDVITFDTTIF